MSKIQYPNRKHQNADEGAKRRAIRQLNAIIEDAQYLIKTIEGGGRSNDLGTTKGLAQRTANLVAEVAAMEILTEVREWHEADISDGRIFTGGETGR